MINNKTNIRLKMTDTLILIIIFIFPIFGKAIDFSESIFFYSIPSILFFYLFFYKKIRLFLKIRESIVLIILIFFFLISTVYSKNIGLSYYYFFTFLNTLLLFLIALKTIKSQNFQFALIVSSLIYSLVFLFNKIGIIPLIPKEVGDNFILQVWGHSYLSDLIVLSIPILLNKIFFEKNKKQRLIFSLILLIVFSSLILTSSRSSWVALFIGLLFLKTNIRNQDKIKKVLISIIFVSLIIFCFIIKQNKIEKKSLTGSRIEYWQHALIGFKNSPIIGNGAGNFYFLNKEYRKNILITGNSAHNSFLNFLCENGIIFTFIFFSLVFLSLIKTKKINNVFFVCSLISIINSLLDPSWSSPGIFIISLYFIFYHTFEFENKKNQLSQILLFCIALISFLFFISKTFSDFLFIKNKYQQSLLYDPFNLNSRIALISSQNLDSKIWQKNKDFTLTFFANDEIVYKAIVENPLMSQEKQKYYQKLLQLNPVEYKTLSK